MNVFQQLLDWYEEDSNHWTRIKMFRFRQSQQGSRKLTSACLVGGISYFSLRTTQTILSRKSPEFCVLRQAIEDVTGRKRRSIMFWNDRRDTDIENVKRVLRRASVLWDERHVPSQRPLGPTAPFIVEFPETASKENILV